MKLLFKHELPKRLSYAKVYLEAGSASLFFSLDGNRASWYASIGSSMKRPVSFSDRDYSLHRASSRVVEVVDHDEDRIVLRTENGVEEEWVRPKWILAGLRRARVREGTESSLTGEVASAQGGSSD
jgi:hypothetical protein